MSPVSATAIEIRIGTDNIAKANQTKPNQTEPNQLTLSTVAYDPSYGPPYLSGPILVVINV